MQSDGEQIGCIVALRWAHGRLYAVGVSDELEPDDLRLLTEKYGGIRFSTSAENRRSDPLRITEISLPAKAGHGRLAGSAVVETGRNQRESPDVG